MFQLGGVAGYLFRPLAEAVVFALIGSFMLSRTLVPTMADYLLRAHTGHARGTMPRTRRTFAQSAQALSDGFRATSSR